MHDPNDLLPHLGIHGDIPRIVEALTHSSFVNEHPGAVDYQQLELLGDAVLGLCVTELLLERVPSAREGRLTRMRASLVNTEALSTFAREIDLLQWVRLGRGAASDATRSKVLADVVEAIVGAVYVAQGLDAARALTLRIAGDAIERHTAIALRDPKSELQERTQRGGGDAPDYRVTDVQGPDHDHRFEVAVYVHGRVLGRGRGRSKKSAEQAAASVALQALQAERGDE